MLKYFYQEVVAIEGKGLGCVATRDIKKNTLILQEIPQIFLKHDIKEEFGSWVTKLMYQFNRMSKKDQKDFLKLPTKPKGQIISECPYEIIVYPKIATKKFPRFLSWKFTTSRLTQKESLCSVCKKIDSVL